jgi:uncharacterized protein YbaA (DUF1428 family)
MCVDGFVLAVATANREAFRHHARDHRVHGLRGPPMPFDGRRVVFGRFEATVSA